MTTRRHFIAATGAVLLGGPALLRARSPDADPFALGVTAGDPAADGFVIWTRLAPRPLELHGGMPMTPLPVTWQVAEDSAFTRVAASGETVARPELGHSVHVEVQRLKPDRSYWYRFESGGAMSRIGHARTLPLPGSRPAAIRFGVAGCQNYEQGYYTAFRHLAGEDLAFVYHYGDFIYEGASRPTGPAPTPWGTTLQNVRSHLGQACYTLGDYRQRYSQYLTDTDLADARARHVWLASFDDHEVANNWADSIDPAGTPPEIFAMRRQAALQAWYEFMPVRRASLPAGAEAAMYRRFAVGDLLSVNVLDTRQYRSDQPCGDGFKPGCPEVASPTAQMLSEAQEKWLLDGLRSGGARWNCIAQQVMMMPLDRRGTPDAPEPVLNLDSWAGYRAPRERLMRALHGVDNVVVLTGDEHRHFVGELNDDRGPVGVELVCTSISSGGDGSDRRADTDMLLANNPQLKFVGDQRGYLVCDVARDGWTSRLMVVDQVSEPGAPVSTRLRVEVAAGEPRVRVA